jgi:beta-glucosidase
MRDQVSTIVDELTLPEKLRLVHGAVDPEGRATGYVPGIERLDVPPLRLVDGPLGVRAVGDSATAFPASMALAASWNPDLARAFGAALGRETAAANQDGILAPGVNVVRVPTGGRNFEYYSEDPTLSATIGVGTIDGIQSEGVAATVKHFVANNQETNRFEVSAEVSERALREIYLPAFRAAVEEADVASVMSAYNRVNGTYMSEHEHLLSAVLRDEWGFEGVVVSDWWGTRSTVAAANAGLDLEMPGITFEEFLPEDAVDPDALEGEGFELPHDPDVPAYFGEPLRRAVDDGSVSEAVLDEKVERVLRLVAAYAGAENDGRAGALDTAGHRELAQRIAVEGSVLLKNDGDVLPLDVDDSLAVVGPNADEAKLGGGGSSEVTPTVELSPVDGLGERFDERTFERGVPPITETSVFGGDRASGDEVDASIDDAVAAAAAADSAVVVVQDDASEFVDRDGMALPGDQDELVSRVADVADRTVVVLRTSGPVEMPWLDAVDAVLETWYPGQADGAALADVLVGDADPGGRLPVTFGRSAADYPTAETRSYPGIDDVARYDEGVFVGYRHFGREGIEPVFPFGHGGSYADIVYGDPSVTVDADGWTVTVPLENRSDRPGTEVVQVYAEKTAAPVDSPPRELVTYRRLSLGSGAVATATIPVSEEDLAYYGTEDGWTVPTGTNVIHVGRSVRDVRSSVEVDV